MRALLLLLAACGADPFGGPTIASATPPYGPLVGGTRITIHGSGFDAGANRVLVAGREAPLASAIGGERLVVVVPPGERPGDAELVVLNASGNAHATGVFHYSEPPTIEAVAPADVLFAGSPTVVTVTGTGFLDEGAGELALAIDGVRVEEVHVASDTTLTFVAPEGRPFVRPDLDLVGVRGAATRTRAFRYTPNERGGLLLFALSGLFAVFYDPVDGHVLPIPWVTTPATRFTAVVHDDDGDYWGLDRSRRFGRIDMRVQRLEAPVVLGGWMPTLMRMDGELFTFERSTQSFGRFDARTGLFTPIGTPGAACCGSYGLAHDGTNVYLATRSSSTGTVQLAAIDRATGAAAAPVTLAAPPSFHIEDMRFFRGTLYATSRDGTLATIDPLTGVTTVRAALGRFNAMDVWEP